MMAHGLGCDVVVATTFSCCDQWAKKYGAAVPLHEHEIRESALAPGHSAVVGAIVVLFVPSSPFLGLSQLLTQLSLFISGPMWGNTLCSAAAQSAPWTALVSPRYCLRRCLRLNSLASTRGTNTVTSCCSVDHRRPLEQCSAANAVVLRPIMMRALYRGLFNGRCQVHCRIAALHRCDGHGRRLAPCRPLSVDALPCS